MKTYRTSKAFPASCPRPIVALGNFDGVHLAHQKMFQQTLRLAKKVKGTALAYTFDPHPVRVLSKESAPPMIHTLAQRLELMAGCGLQAVVVEPFDLKLAHLGAEDWFHKTLGKKLHAHGLVAGYDFTFGSHRSGTVETLEKLCAQSGVICKILEAQMKGETLISSTQIRHFLQRGDLIRARELLGRPYFVDGKVIRGAGRGAQLGIPTANLKIENDSLLLPGVYACRAQVGGKTYPAVTNIGMNPTFGGNALTVEAHLLRFKREIYGEKLRLHFYQRIREERAFASAAELVKQIHQDIEHAKKVLQRLPS